MSGGWVTSRATEHVAVHTESAAGVAAGLRAGAKLARLGKELDGGEEEVLGASVKMHKARSYIYCAGEISQRTVASKLSHAPLVAAAEYGARMAGAEPEMAKKIGEGVPHLTERELKGYIRAEYANFVKFVRLAVGAKLEASGSNSFGQFQHDAGTLDNHRKYEAAGLQMVLPGAAPLSAEWGQAT